MEEKFKELKEKFKKFPIRAYPRYREGEAPFEVWPDFSNQALGHVLQQRQDGKLRLIAVGGQKTTPGESNYVPTKGEISTIMHGDAFSWNLLSLLILASKLLALPLS